MVRVHEDDGVSVVGVEPAPAPEMKKGLAAPVQVIDQLISLCMMPPLPPPIVMMAARPVPPGGVVPGGAGGGGEGEGGGGK